MKKIRMWIARDEGIYNDDFEVLEKGKLHLFYDTPLVKKNSDTNTLKFDCSRCIGEIPSYMYPWVKEGDCYELESSTLYCSNFKRIKS